MRDGTLGIGLTAYQETQWLSAIKQYGVGIMEKSLLSLDQKKILQTAAKQTNRCKHLDENVGTWCKLIDHVCVEFLQPEDPLYEEHCEEKDK